MQKEQALRSDSGLKGKDCRWGRVHRNNMCLSRIQLPVIRARTVVHMLLVLVSAMCQKRKLLPEFFLVNGEQVIWPTVKPTPTNEHIVMLVMLPLVVGSIVDVRSSLTADL